MTKILPDRPLPDPHYRYDAVEYTIRGLPKPKPDPEAELAAEKRAKLSRQSVLEKAQAIVAERGKTYGTPINDFTRLAKLWSAILGTPITAEQTIRCMIAVKLSRLSETPGHEDSILDIAGYAWVLDEVRKHGTED